MRRVFISYRRSDSSESTGRIYDHLAARYGRNNVFTDVDSIPIGRDFVREIEESIRASQAVLVVIGPHWGDVRDNSGSRRLEDPRDVVRLEIETALREQRRLVPVLVQNANMPAESELPDSLKPLLRVNAAVVRSGRDFANDMRRLMASIDPPRPARRVLLWTAGVALAVLAAVLLMRQLPPGSPHDPHASAIGSVPVTRPPLRTDSRGVPMSANPAENSIDRVLRKKQVEFWYEFVETPLQDAMSGLSDWHSIPISIDKPALEQQGMSLDASVNGRLSGDSFHNALFSLLKPLGLTYVVEGNGLRITTEAAAERVIQIRMYDIADLTVREWPSSHLVQAIQGSGDWASSDALRINDSLKDVLVVTAPVSVHDRIEGFLSALRESRR